MKFVILLALILLPCVVLSNHRNKRQAQLPICARADLCKKKEHNTCGAHTSCRTVVGSGGTLKVECMCDQGFKKINLTDTACEDPCKPTKKNKPCGTHTTCKTVFENGAVKAECRCEPGFKKSKPQDTDCIAPCPVKWREYKGYCYYYSDGDRKNYQDARKLCRGKNQGDLASIHSLEENEFIWKSVEGQKYGAYLGLHKATGGTWAWTDGTTFEYNRWGDFQAGSEPDHDCGKMNEKDNGKWENWKCDSKLPFVCKKVAIH